MKNIGLMFKESFYATKNLIVKNRSEIMMTLGIVGFIGASVSSSVATLKVTAVLDDRKKLLTSIDDAFNDPDFEDDYTEEEKNNDTFKVNTCAAIQIAGLYAPAVALTCLSIVSLVISHKMMKDKVAALAMAYTALSERFQKYRLGVIDKYGKEVDKELYTNQAQKSISTEELNKRVAEENINVNAVDLLFDECNSTYCRKDAYYHYTFLKSSQEWINVKLRTEGKVFVNDVRDLLGFERTKEGQVVGWIYDPDNVNHKGANHIDFGIFNGEKESEAFCNQKELYVWLHLNPDGYIFDKI